MMPKNESSDNSKSGSYSKLPKMTFPMFDGGSPKIVD